MAKQAALEQGIAPGAAGRIAPTRAGRPTAARAEAIERAILDAGRRRFLAAGFGPTAMEAIALEAGVSKSTLYARYPTKEALLRAIALEQTEIWTAAQHRHRGPIPDDGKARLRFYAHAIMYSMCTPEIRAFGDLLQRAGDPEGDLFKALHQVSYDPTIDELAAAFRHAARDFDAPPRDARRVAEMVMAMLTGWHIAQSRIRTVSLEEALLYADHAVDMTFAGRSAW